MPLGVTVTLKNFSVRVIFDVNDYDSSKMTEKKREIEERDQGGDRWDVSILLMLESSA